VHSQTTSAHDEMFEAICGPDIEETTCAAELSRMSLVACRLTANVSIKLCSPSQLISWLDFCLMVLRKGLIDCRWDTFHAVTNLALEFNLA
jgi:hypothetical protein